MAAYPQFLLIGTSLLGLYLLSIALRSSSLLQSCLAAVFVVLYGVSFGASELAVMNYGLLILIVQLARQGSYWRWPIRLLALAYALAIVLKLLPGFTSIGPVASQTLSATSGNWTIYGNTNKALVGLILLPLVRYPACALSQLSKHVPVLILGPLLIAVLSYLSGLAFDFKISQFTALFLFGNLVFTVLAEEIFFRGLIQQYLCELLPGRYRIAAGIVLASCLFGLAHAGGGLRLVVLASVAGLAYGFAYWRTQSIWGAVLVHLSVNALHMVFLEYPGW